MSDFAYHCNMASDGLVIKRLEQLFDVFILDEAQDISGYDFDFIELLLHSKIKVIMVGDVRQKTYSTTKSTKNKKFSNDIYKWFQHLEAKGYGELTILNQSHRCIQQICDFADALFPALPNSKSLNLNISNHDGIFLVSPCDLTAYYALYKPQILIYDKRAASKANGLPVNNFGAVKGQTYNRVVIIPTKPIEKYLCNGRIAEVESSIEKFYVAITRARHSVAFLATSTPSLPSILKWECPQTD
ncbi:UvrD-helicase domain-containing protein [Desulfitobacterium sp.]|uniref:UvrD-helicase domain-containing protein n=1 Tax=Desulfitobacterium sp. TaxID=49981 RepID=UPI002B7B8991|nr:UvrD-helicase domain-containing protein [Desulfitobacterium sp.]HVJ50703.1 UvrD-helicase domain-containing protein [Desulfitobacterium sp.]